LGISGLRLVMVIDRSLFGLSLPLDNCRKTAKGVVNRFVVRKIFGDIGINNYNIGPFGIPLCILTADSPSEVILFEHLRIIFHYFQ